MSSENGENRGGELPDEQADALLDQLAARADERDDIDLRPASKRSISRRSFLGAVGVAGAGALAMGSQNAEAQTGQWGNATGSAGTESKPFNEAWVKDFYSQSVESDEINNKVTPNSANLAAIQSLIDAGGRVTHIDLKPGVLYEGDTQLTINTEADDSAGTSRTVVIDATGAGVNYTGSEQNAVEVFSGTLGDTEFGGRVVIKNGSWWGPTGTNSAVFRLDDVFRGTVKPSAVYRSEHGILAVNNEEWSEGLTLKVDRRGGYEGSDSPAEDAPTTSVVRLAGGGSSLPNADGTSSFRNTEVAVEWLDAADGGTTIWLDNATAHGGKVTHRAFLPADGVGLRVDNGGPSNVYTKVYFESEGGNSNSVPVELNTDNPPTFIGPRVVGGQSTHTGTGGAVGYARNSIRSLPGNGPWNGGADAIQWGDTGVLRSGSQELRPSSSLTWDYHWMTLTDSDGTPRFQIGNHRDDFTLRTRNGGKVRTADGSDATVPHLASEHQSEGAAGVRSHLGAYAEHPSGAGNGDTWYIDGSGTPSEGFYGQTSSGVVQIG